MRLPCVSALCVSALFFATASAQIPRTWDENALRDWATPIAALGVRPSHFSAADYYRARVDNLKTYPVFFPGREPQGYWKSLTRLKPRPLIDPTSLKTPADWIEAGQRVFDELDIPEARSFNPKIIAKARSLAFYQKAKETARPDGIVPAMRWVVTPAGVALTASNCSICHVRWIQGKAVPGAPFNVNYSDLLFEIAPPGVSFIKLPGDSPNDGLLRSYTVPWIQDDENKLLTSLKPPALGELLNRSLTNGMFARWNGSPLYPTKVPDLIGIEDRKWIDATATHQNRGPGDLMRYSALVSYSDSSDFGPHRILTDRQRRVPSRLPDEAWYALAQYLYSLKPPQNPNRFDTDAAAGKTVFEKQGCPGCHPAPLYTNNKLTLADGYHLPADSPLQADVLPISVGTDPGLALKTRKGTGVYKVPSLKGLWYRGHYLHDGSFTTLEEMFNPERLQTNFAPSGWNPIGKEHRAVPGHPFGLKLNSQNRVELISFLRTL